MKRRQLGMWGAAAALGLVLLGGVAAGDDAAPAKRLSLTAWDREPKRTPGALDEAKAKQLRDEIGKAPRDRAPRMALVKLLTEARQLEAALSEARSWREHDAYDLVVVRLIGDLLTELGRKEEARRAYSAVVELLPGDPQAQRALATVLKQSGDLEGAHARLSAAARARPEDMRIQFELADVANRLGRADEAATLLEGVVARGDAAEAVRYPAKQRLAQIYAARRRAALAGGDSARAQQLEADIAKLAVKGGIENDLKVYLTWDTDRSDVDLWVTTPRGEKVFYSHKEGQGGEALFDDVTTGYGPESFTAQNAARGAYLVQVNYYGTGRAQFAEARGEVVVILNEGKPDEQRHVLPYRLFDPGETVTVAKIDVR